MSNLLNVLCILLIVITIFSFYCYGTIVINKNEKLARYKGNKIASIRIGTWILIKKLNKFIVPEEFIERETLTW